MIQEEIELQLKEVKGWKYLEKSQMIVSLLLYYSLGAFYKEEDYINLVTNVSIFILKK